MEEVYGQAVELADYVSPGLVFARPVSFPLSRASHIFLTSSASFEPSGSFVISSAIRFQSSLSAATAIPHPRAKSKKDGEILIMTKAGSQEILSVPNRTFPEATFGYGLNSSEPLAMRCPTYGASQGEKRELAIGGLRLALHADSRVEAGGSCEVSNRPGVLFR